MSMQATQQITNLNQDSQTSMEGKSKSKGGRKPEVFHSSLVLDQRLNITDAMEDNTTLNLDYKESKLAKNEDGMEPISMGTHI